MPTPAPSWNTCRVFGTWHRMDGTLRAGNYKVTIPVRVTNATDDVIIPAGEFAAGPLNVAPGLPSLDLAIPATDDPDNFPTGFQVTLEVTFLDAAGEKYVLDLPVGGTVNLRTVLLADTLPVAKELLIVGVPGGLAQLDSDGDVVDADGVKVTGGGGLDEAALGTYLATGGYATESDVTAATTGLVPATRTIAGKPLSADVTLTAADVSAVPTTRTVAGKALSANVTLVKADVGLGSVDNTADTAKPVSTAQQAALDAKAPLASPAFTGTPTGITKTHVGLANVDNTSDANKPVSTAQATALALKAPLASPAFTGAPTGITKTHVGLANVDNTSDANKPVSTATATALAGKSAVVALSTATTSQRIVIVPTAADYAGQGQAGDIVLVLTV